MGQSTEELSGEIAQTRQSLSSDLDALQDRVSPSAIVERRKQAARDRVTSIRHRVMGKADAARGTTGGTASGVASTAQEKYDGAPLAAGLVAFGAGLVVASLLPASEKEAVAAGRVLDTAKEQAQPLLEEAKAQAQHVAGQVGERASDAAQEVKQAATESADRVSSEGQSAVKSVRDDASSE